MPHSIGAGCCLFQKESGNVSISLEANLTVCWKRGGMGGGGQEK